MTAKWKWLPCSRALFFAVILVRIILFIDPEEGERLRVDLILIPLIGTHMHPW
jgi:hypothetical protein